MTTQTQTLRRQKIQPTRVHDYLYDNHFYVSSDRDHARATLQAHTSIGRVKRVPIFETMFSELRHMPRFDIQLDITDPVPKSVSRQWRGYKEQQRDKLIQLKSFNYDSRVAIPVKTYDAANVTGPNRYKYFRRPIIPFMQQVPADVFLSSARVDQQMGLMSTEMQKPVAVTSYIRSIYTQTDYRESEAQTDPYTPEYVVRPGSQPELLTLATLSYGHGLPASLAEVQMIERARAKRRWEATLPPLNDLSQLKKRQHMMEEMERSEWALREQEIEKLQEARLEVLKVLLLQREENHQDLNTKRLDRLWSKKQQIQAAKVKKIRHEHIRTIRRLCRERQNVEGKMERRDWVNDYASYGSETYAPFTRHGVFLDHGADQNIVRSRYLTTYEGLLELENCLPEFVTQPRVRAPQPKYIPKEGYVKKQFRNERELNEIYTLLEEKKNRVAAPPKPLRFLQRIEKPIPRPRTPAIEVPNEDEENRELAVIFLQQVIRGRAVQDMMYEGKEKRIELIRELRSTHALQEAEQEVKRQELHATGALQRQRRLHEHREHFVDSCLSRLEGGSLGDVLDFLSKELVRLQEERRIHAFAMLAERQRRGREAEESGRRLVEERRRREQDEIFKQTVKVHQQSVDSYLETIIMTSMEGTAEEQARSEIHALATKINDIAYEMENRRTVLESEEIVSELVHSFLLPEVSKRTMREKVQRQQRKYLLAAHKQIHEGADDVMELCPKADSPPPSTSAERVAATDAADDGETVETGALTGQPAVLIQGASVEQLGDDDGTQMTGGEAGTERDVDSMPSFTDTTAVSVVETSSLTGFVDGERIDGDATVAVTAASDADDTAAVTSDGDVTAAATASGANVTVALAIIAPSDIDVTAASADDVTAVASDSDVAVAVTSDSDVAAAKASDGDVTAASKASDGDVTAAATATDDDVTASAVASSGDVAKTIDGDVTAAVTAASDADITASAVASDGDVVTAAAAAATVASGDDVTAAAAVSSGDDVTAASAVPSGDDVTAATSGDDVTAAAAASGDDVTAAAAVASGDDVTAATAVASGNDVTVAAVASGDDVTAAAVASGDDVTAAAVASGDDVTAAAAVASGDDVTAAAVASGDDVTAAAAVASGDDVTAEAAAADDADQIIAPDGKLSDDTAAAADDAAKADTSTTADASDIPPENVAGDELKADEAEDFEDTPTDPTQAEEEEEPQQETED